MMLPGVLESLNPLYSLSLTHQELTRPAVYHFANSFLDVTPVESTIQCFIHPTGSLTVNRLKMVILLSGNTTWHVHRPTHTTHTLALTHTQTHGKVHMDPMSEGTFLERKRENRPKWLSDWENEEQRRLVTADSSDEQTRRSNRPCFALQTMAKLNNLKWQGVDDTQYQSE